MSVSWKKVQCAHLIISCNFVLSFYVTTEIAWITVVGKQGTILRSSDGGLTWKRQISGVSVDLIDVHFPTSREGYIVGENSTFLRTRDGGARWEQSNVDASSAHYFGVDCFAPPATSFVFVVGEQGLLLISTDHGSEGTWQLQQLPTDCFAPTAMACVTSNEWTEGNGAPDLLKARFFDSKNGVIIGRFQSVLVTGDAGASFRVVRPVDFSGRPWAAFAGLGQDQLGNVVAVGSEGQAVYLNFSITSAGDGFDCSFQTLGAAGLGSFQQCYNATPVAPSRASVFGGALMGSEMGASLADAVVGGTSGTVAVFDGQIWTFGRTGSSDDVVGIYSLLEHPDKLVAVSRGGRIYRTADGGRNFSLVLDLSADGITLAAISGRSPAEENAGSLWRRRPAATTLALSLASAVGLSALLLSAPKPPVLLS